MLDSVDRCPGTPVGVEVDDLDVLKSNGWTVMEMGYTTIMIIVLIHRSELKWIDMDVLKVSRVDSDRDGVYDE